jgi:hypothetical protein
MRSIVAGYRYALAPSMTQATAIKRTGNAARRCWNGLVEVERWAEDEITAGVTAYRELLQQRL